jgi:hypothetical protein
MDGSRNSNAITKVQYVTNQNAIYISAQREVNRLPSSRKQEMNAKPKS